MDASMVQVNLLDVPQEEIDADIRHFLQERFALLRWRKKLLATHANAIEVLTEKSERLFIYARMVIEYLDHKIQETSLRRLDMIFDDGAGKVGMPALDDLYDDILQNAYDDESLEGDDVCARVNALLAGLVAFQRDVTVEVLAPLMGLEEDALITTVQELRSLLSCSSEDLRTAVIRPLHLTFAEFLVDGNRSKRSKGRAFSIDRGACHLKFAKACLRVLNTELRDSICENEDARSERDKGYEEHCRVDWDLSMRKHIPAYAQYACRHWATHIIENEPISDLDLPGPLDRFCRKNLLQWIDALVSMNIVREAKEALLRAQLWAKVSVFLSYKFNLLKCCRLMSGMRVARGLHVYIEHSL
jgi:hypothetical protein